MTNALKIVFAGTPAFGIPCLDALLASKHHLTAVYTQPDRPAGRGRKMQMSAVKEWALAHQLPVYQPENFKTHEAMDELAKLAPDVLVVIAYGLILPQAILNIPRLGCVNVHASLLPRWRGASPIQHALLYGDQQSGVTIMQMDAGMDTGAMLTQATCAIQQNTPAHLLHDTLSQLSAAPLIETLEALASGKEKSQPQDDTLATYAPKIKKEDARIDWHKQAFVIHQQIRAFNPWPIAYTHAADELLKIHQADRVDQAHTHLPGTIVSLDKSGMLVATGEGLIRATHIQFPGGKVLSIAETINANHNKLYRTLILQ